MANSGGSLAYNGQVNEGGYSRGTKKYDHNHSGLTPVTTGSRTNLKGNQGGLSDISGSQPILGGKVTPANSHVGSRVDKHVDTNVRGSRTNLRGNM